MFGEHVAAPTRRVILAGVIDALRETPIEAYDRTISLELGDVVLDGCITKAPRGGEKVGRSPVR